MQKAYRSSVKNFHIYLMMTFLKSSHFLLFALIICNWRDVEGHDYHDALAKSILFFQGQRSGKLPERQDIDWRANSGLSDGHVDGVDLTGGYYDAGDNVKFNFPMAFSMTMLSWGTIEYGSRMKSKLDNARDGIRWGTDYLLKCAQGMPDQLFVGVADPNKDHSCWERPEDMDTDRSVYSVSPNKPGSDVAGETAAALAAASIVFRKVDPNYSKSLLQSAKNVMQFAINHQGAYSDSLASSVCPFYCSYSGYKDELLWGATWLYRATNYDEYYMNFITSLGACDETDIFSWDNKYAGAYVLLARRYLVNKDTKFQQFSQEAEKFMCKILFDTEYTKGGLMYKMDQSNLQYVTSITFLLTTYAKYMAKYNHDFKCGNGHIVTSNYLRVVAKTQVDYILGDNPLKMSYMVGYGQMYPKRIHHRGSSLPSIGSYSQHIECQNEYLNTRDPNPNILIGAIVGGPNGQDEFLDDRTDYSHSEPATYINAAIVGPLAYFFSWGQN